MKVKYFILEWADGEIEYARGHDIGAAITACGKGTPKYFVAADNDDVELMLKKKINKKKCELENLQVELDFFKKGGTNDTTNQTQSKNTG